MPWLEPFASLVDPTGGPLATAGVAIEDPTAGRIEGAVAVVAFLAESAEWLRGAPGSHPPRRDDDRRRTPGR